MAVPLLLVLLIGAVTSAFKAAEGHPPTYLSISLVVTGFMLAAAFLGVLLGLLRYGVLAWASLASFVWWMALLLVVMTA